MLPIQRQKNSMNQLTQDWYPDRNRNLPSGLLEVGSADRKGTNYAIDGRTASVSARK